MPWTWRTTHDGPSNTWTTTCTVCGEFKRANYHTELVSFRRAHAAAGCVPPDQANDQTTGGQA